MTDSLRTLPIIAAREMSRWPSARVTVLILAGTFLGLAADLRLEHVEAVHENKLAWTPIVYCCITAMASALAGWRWSLLTRRVALACFIAGIVVGCLGFYLHNQSDLFQVPLMLLHAWTDPTLQHSAAPPQNAPMTLAMLGLLGAVACWKQGPCRQDTARSRRAGD